jgi:glycosyltransferase involved in cell wall biosynthesis
MNSQFPLVSIVTNSFNYGRFIEDTLLSVKNQDYPNIEHIVVDGGSTDNTLELLKKYKNLYNLKWISEPDKGQTNAINKGFKRSKGEIIGWLDADDVYFDRHCISSVVEVFRSRPDLDAIFGNDVLMDENNVIFRARHFPQWNYKRILRRFYISQPTTFFRSRVTQNYSMDENLKFAMDLEYFLRIGKTCKIEHVNRILASTRVHSGRKSISKKMLAVKEDNEVLRKFGHKFDLSYYLYTFFVDFPATTAERMLGIGEILNMKKTLEFLAFEGAARGKWRSIISQFAPESMLKMLLRQR